MLLFLGCCSILESTISEESGRYAGFAAIAEAITSVVGLTSADDKINNSEEEKEALESVLQVENDMTEEEIQLVREKATKTKKLEDKVEKKEGNDEESIEDDVSDEDDSSVNIQYGFHEEQFIANLYKQHVLNYVKLFYGETEQASVYQAEEIMYQETTISDTKTEMMSIQEAEETVKAIQYTTAMGAGNEVSIEKKRRLDIWIKNNPVEFAFFQSNFAVTQDVNYAPPR